MFSFSIDQKVRFTGYCRITEDEAGNESLSKKREPFISLRHFVLAELLRKRDKSLRMEAVKLETPKQVKIFWFRVMENIDLTSIDITTLYKSGLWFLLLQNKLIRDKLFSSNSIQCKSPALKETLLETKQRLSDFSLQNRVAIVSASNDLLSKLDDETKIDEIISCVNPPMNLDIEKWAINQCVPIKHLPINWKQFGEDAPVKRNQILVRRSSKIYLSTNPKNKIEEHLLTLAEEANIPVSYS